MKNILIASYYFSPCNRVGCRRWVKFAKYLQSENYNIHIISVNTPYIGVCPWLEDTKYIKNITRLDFINTKPYFMRNMSPQNLIGKIRYKLSEKFFKQIKKTNRFDINDNSIAYQKEFLKTCKQLISKNNIETFIVTGGPFEWCYYANSLKNDFENLKIITDLRDFWSKPDKKYINKNIAKSTLKKEEYCIQQSTYITTPSIEIANHLKSTYPKHAHKIKEIAHGYDEDDFIFEKKEINTLNAKTITFIYAGILYDNMQNTMEDLCKIILKFLEKNIIPKVSIYTSNKLYQNIFKEHNVENYIHYFNTVNSKEITKIIMEHDYSLQLRAGETQEQHFKSSKYFELIATKIPILYIGPKGSVGENLQKNQLGFDFNNYNYETIVNQLIENKISKNIPKNFLALNNYSFKNLTQELIDLL